MAKKQIKNLPGFYWKYVGKTRIAENPLSGETLSKSIVEKIQKGVDTSKGTKNWKRVTFTKLNDALNFASKLPSSVGVLITGYGNIMHGITSAPEGMGWLTLTQFSKSNVFRQPQEREAINQKIAQKFSSGRKQYEVQWR